MLYSTYILDEVFKGLTLPRVDTALAFWNIVRSFQLSLKECPLAVPHDRWLLSQLGAALLLHCEHCCTWEKGFQILYCLHVHGIWYINIPRPVAKLQSYPTHVSDCSIALAAVNICLKTNNPGAAIQVLNSCGWVKAANTVDASRRMEYMVKLLEHCIRNGQLHDAQKCLTELLDSRESGEHTLQAVNSLGNRLIRLMLRTSQEDSAVEVCNALQTCKVLVPSETFSNLLSCLVNKGKSDTAKDLCKNAIKKGIYGELAVNGDASTIRLPAGLTQLEIYYLLENHINSFAAKSHNMMNENLKILFVPGKFLIIFNYIQCDIRADILVYFSLTIDIYGNHVLLCFPTDVSQTLETVLAVDFVPSLSATVSTHWAMVSSDSIQKWRGTQAARIKKAVAFVKVMRND